MLLLLYYYLLYRDCSWRLLLTSLTCWLSASSWWKTHIINPRSVPKSQIIKSLLIGGNVYPRYFTPFRLTFQRRLFLYIYMIYASQNTKCKPQKNKSKTNEKASRRQRNYSSYGLNRNLSIQVCTKKRILLILLLIGCTSSYISPTLTLQLSSANMDELELEATSRSI